MRREVQGLEDSKRRTASEAWGRALEADARGASEQAIAELRTVCALDPGNYEARRLLGINYLTCGRHEEALDEFALLCSVDRGSGEAWGLAAFALCAMGEMSDAMRAYRISMECSDPSVPHYLNLGSLCLAKGNFVEAEEVLFEAARLWPHYPAAHYKLGLAREALGNQPGAMASYRRAIELNDKWVGAHLSLGSVCEAAGCLEDAFQAYSRAIELSPNSVVGREGMVRICDLIGQRGLAAVHRSVLFLMRSGDCRWDGLERAA